MFMYPYTHTHTHTHTEADMYTSSYLITKLITKK